MAIKAGQYLINPAIAAGAIGGGAGFAMEKKGVEGASTSGYAKDGAAIGFGIGAVALGFKGLRSYKQGTFTNPLQNIMNKHSTGQLSAEDLKKLTPQQIALLKMQGTI